MRVRTLASRPTGASIAPEAGGSPCTSARYRRRMVRSASCFTSDVCAATVFATTRRPLVSLSRRWTMPARGGAFAIDGDVAGAQPFLQAVTRVLVEEPRERLVEAQAAHFRRHGGLQRRDERRIPLAIIVATHDEKCTGSPDRGSPRGKRR